MAVTFHRAFDVCYEPFKALEDLIEIGIDRILTSGQHPTAAEGAGLIAKLVKIAADRISILACGGLNVNNIAHVAKATGAREFHFTAFEDAVSPMTFRNLSVSMGGSGDASEYTRRITSAENVRKTIEAAKAGE
jgi:copper homeostasis protein